ncbi:MAG: F0F1 ATP synthase subunit B [Nitrospirota bacterium]|jgi:F-type H+-transporting ATPase subunit b
MTSMKELAKRYLPLVPGALFLCALLAGPVFGAPEGGGEEHGSVLLGFLWQLINFAILAAALIYFGRKPVRDFFRTRSETIKKSLDEAREAKELAQKALDEVEQRLREKDKEAEEMMRLSTERGGRERDRLHEEGERLSQKILEQARVNIDFELNQARAAIKAEAVELAMELAEKRLEGKITKDEQERLLEEALGKIEKE